MGNKKDENIDWWGTTRQPVNTNQIIESKLSSKIGRWTRNFFLAGEGDWELNNDDVRVSNDKWIVMKQCGRLNYGNIRAGRHTFWFFVTLIEEKSFEIIITKKFNWKAIHSGMLSRPTIQTNEWSPNTVGLLLFKNILSVYKKGFCSSICWASYNKLR